MCFLSVHVWPHIAAPDVLKRPPLRPHRRTEVKETDDGVLVLDDDEEEAVQQQQPKVCVSRYYMITINGISLFCCCHR